MAVSNRGVRNMTAIQFRAMMTWLAGAFVSVLLLISSASLSHLSL